MPNGKMTTKEYLVQIFERVDNLKEDITEMKTTLAKQILDCAVRKELDKHKKAHWQFWLIMCAVPTAIYYIIKIIGG